MFLPGLTQCVMDNITQCVMRVKGESICVLSAFVEKPQTKPIKNSAGIGAALDDHAPSGMRAAPSTQPDSLQNSQRTLPRAWICHTTSTSSPRTP